MLEQLATLGLLPGGRSLSYTAQLGLTPVEEFEIKLGKKQIRLVPVGGMDEEDGAAEAA